MSFTSPSILAETITLFAVSPLITKDFVPLRHHLLSFNEALFSIKLSSYRLFISVCANAINSLPSTIWLIKSKLGLLTENQKKKVKLANSIVDRGAVLSAGQKAMIERQNIVTLVKGNAIKLKDAILDKAEALYLGTKMGLMRATVAVQRQDYLLKLKKSVVDKISAAYDATRLAITSAIGIAGKINLGTLIAEKAAQVGTIVMLGARLAIQTAIAAAAANRE